MIDPRLLCRKHLLGEHGEIHKHRHNFVKKHRISGRLFPVVQIEPLSMETRHNQLADEMTRRGYNHASPYMMPDISHLSSDEMNARVDIKKSIMDLYDRCQDCKKLGEL